MADWLIGETANQIKSSKLMLVFGERGKSEYPEKDLLEQTREPINSTHMWLQTPVTLVGGMHCNHSNPCYPRKNSP